MNINRRTILLAAGALPFAHMARFAHADQYPSKTIHVVVPASAATSIDVTTRFFSEPLAKRINTPVVVENRPGTGGLIAYSGVAKSEPDGYTIMLAGIPMYLLPLLSQGTVTFDPLQDLVHVARVARVPFGLVVSADSPYQTLDDLLKAMKDKPGEITYSSQGVGSSAHLCGALFTHMSKTQAQHIPYKSTTTATTDVAGGRVDFTMQTGPAILGMIKGGKLRLLAVSGDRRWDAFPDVPTVDEAGVTGYELSSWLDFVAPRGVPEPVLELLSNNLLTIAKEPEFKAFCDRQVIFPEAVGYKELAGAGAAEAEKWKNIVALI